MCKINTEKISLCSDFYSRRGGPPLSSCLSDHVFRFTLLPCIRGFILEINIIVVENGVEDKPVIAVAQVPPEGIESEEKDMTFSSGDIQDGSFTFDLFIAAYDPAQT